MARSTVTLTPGMFKGYVKRYGVEAVRCAKCFLPSPDFQLFDMVVHVRNTHGFMPRAKRRARFYHGECYERLYLDVEDDGSDVVAQEA